jgi:uncharacterized GH25 family protein
MVTQILQRLVPKNHKKVEKLKSVLESIENKRASHNLFQIDLLLRNSQLAKQHNTKTIESMDRIVADDEGWGVDARGIHERINRIVEYQQRKYISEQLELSLRQAVWTLVPLEEASPQAIEYLHSITGVDGYDAIH